MLTRILLDSNGQDLAVEHWQDVEPILEQNKISRSLEQHSDCAREIADVPYVILLQWLNEEYARGNSTITLLSEEMDRLAKKKLQDPEWAYLRTDRPALIMGWLGLGT